MVNCRIQLNDSIINDFIIYSIVKATAHLLIHQSVLLSIRVLIHPPTQGLATVFKRFSSLPVLNTLKIQVSAVLADSSLIMELVIFLLSLIFHDQFLACIKQMKIVHYNYNYFYTIRKAKR